MTEQARGHGSANAGRQPEMIRGGATPAEDYFAVDCERIATETVTRTEYPTRHTPFHTRQTSRLRRHEYRIEGDGGFVIYGGDELVGGPDDWTEPQKDRLFALRRTWLDVMGPVAQDFSLVVEVRDTPPGDEDLLAWDHVAEFSLDVTLGDFPIATCPGYNPPPIRVNPDTYRVPLCGGNLNTVYQEDGSPHGGPPRYRLTLWPRDRADIVIVKQWAGRIWA